jgi:chromate transporter
MTDAPSAQMGWRWRWQLFATFFRIGLFTFGGGFAMLPIIEREMVTNKKWLKADELLNIFALAQSMPGPVAVNASTFIGRQLAGTSGAVMAMLGATLPSVLVILIVAAGLAGFQEQPAVQYFFRGVLACVTALILLTAIKMARKVIHGIWSLLLTVLTVFCVTVLQVHALLTIIGGALAGALIYLLRPLIKKDRGTQP